MIDQGLVGGGYSQEDLAEIAHLSTADALERMIDAEERDAIYGGDY